MTNEEMCPDCRDNRDPNDVYSKCICGPPEKYICIICDDWIEQRNDAGCCSKCLKEIEDIELPYFYLCLDKYKKLFKFLIKKGRDRERKEQSKRDVAKFFRQAKEIDILNQYFLDDSDGDSIETEVTISKGDGHEGPGYYAYYTDYSDEGSVFLGEYADWMEKTIV